MLAPRAGLALPLKTPQPVVCGQFPSSHRPTTGIATAVNKRISSSTMKARWLAPNSFPTRVDTAKLSAEGKM
ncbi:hypothetical protein RJ639_005441 [Escallonia herrerae]|uniref:Uncharacterized protein n=1 Tax=Escallonia herrerae TaxID=1293975 RepID=A0AA88VUM0_9ASTE|nr:hypothetical protein RJ639_005441 [Escallonia herrerae]